MEIVKRAIETKSLVELDRKAWLDWNVAKYVKDFATEDEMGVLVALPSNWDCTLEAIARKTRNTKTLGYLHEHHIHMMFVAIATMENIALPEALRTKDVEELKVSCIVANAIEVIDGYVFINEQKLNNGF